MASGYALGDPQHKVALRGRCIPTMSDAGESSGFSGSHVSHKASFLLMGKDTELSYPSVSHVIVEIVLSLQASRLGMNTFQVVRV